MLMLYSAMRFRLPRPNVHNSLRLVHIEGNELNLTAIRQCSSANFVRSVRAFKPHSARTGRTVRFRNIRLQSCVTKQTTV